MGEGIFALRMCLNADGCGKGKGRSPNLPGDTSAVSKLKTRSPQVRGTQGDVELVTFSVVVEAWSRVEVNIRLCRSGILPAGLCACRKDGSWILTRGRARFALLAISISSSRAFFSERNS